MPDEPTGAISGSDLDGDARDRVLSPSETAATLRSHHIDPELFQYLFVVTDGSAPDRIKNPSTRSPFVSSDKIPGSPEPDSEFEV